jgi:hypothetical protein
MMVAVFSSIVQLLELQKGHSRTILYEYLSRSSAELRR